ncbi:MAG: transposase, partial [Chlamydiae bacterium]|nr:transposase [Chlamydiota bacterium]
MFVRIRWAHKNGIEWKFIEPGKPIQNSYIESFNGRIRDKCLNEHWFETPDEAKALI